MTSISIKSPTRVDLAGGTLDLWPLYNFVGGATTTNIAISIYSHAQINEWPGSKIIIESKDLQTKMEFANLAEALASKDKNMALYLPILKFFSPSFSSHRGFHLITQSDSPVGGGLGGSSSLTISILKAFAIWTGVKFKDYDEIVTVAHNLESELLCTPTGKQDYYPAVTAGLSVLDFSSKGIASQALKLAGTPFSDHMILVYTGRAHHSGLNNFEVLKGSVEKDEKTLKALSDLKQVAAQMREVCLKQNWPRLPELFRAEYEARVRLCSSFSSPEIEKLHEISKSHGADATKICGAGGGGCVMIWCQPSKQDKVKQAIEQNGFRILPAHSVDLEEVKAVNEKVFI